MAGRATLMLITIAAFSLATFSLATMAARAQNSEYDALPEPADSAPPPAPAATGHSTQAKGPPRTKQKSAAEIAAEKKAAAQEKAAAAAAEKELPAQKKQNAALNAKQEPAKDKEEDLPARKMAPSAAIPPWPGDEKGPKTIEFLGACPGNFDRCMDQVREIGEKLPDSELCIPSEIYFATVTDRVRKWATLRPDIHSLPAGRVIAAALRSIYPCKHAAAARTAAEKGAPKAAKAAQ